MDSYAHHLTFTVHSAYPYQDLRAKACTSCVRAAYAHHAPANRLQGVRENSKGSNPDKPLERRGTGFVKKADIPPEDADAKHAKSGFCVVS